MPHAHIVAAYITASSQWCTEDKRAYPADRKHTHSQLSFTRHPWSTCAPAFREEWQAGTTEDVGHVQESVRVVVVPQDYPGEWGRRSSVKGVGERCENVDTTGEDIGARGTRATGATQSQTEVRT
jgi:hypothetical protein